MIAVEGSFWQGLEGLFGGGFLLIVLLFGIAFLLAPSEKEALKKRMAEPCQVGRHDYCDGAVGNDRCPCTCHDRPMTSLCADMNRHDACEGLVAMPSGSDRDCGCTCHAARAASRSR